MNIRRFHQFVVVEKGPVNAAIIDLLKGNVFQVENRVLAEFEAGKYDEIEEFLACAAAENLIIEIDEKRWVPAPQEEDEPGFDDEEAKIGIEIHIEAGIEPAAVLEIFKDYPVYRVVFYGEELPEIPGSRVTFVKGKKDFRQCIEKAAVTGEFGLISEPAYRFNLEYNSCWGGKAAVTGDGKVRPCIYSTISVGDIAAGDAREIPEKLEKYWLITANAVKKCRDCELRHICSDCREIAYRQGGDLFSGPPRCHYDPYKGTWKE